MTEIGIIVGAVLVLLLFVGRRRARQTALGSNVDVERGDVSLEAMAQTVSELALTLRPAAMVAAHQGHPDQGYIWASPCGKRVYLN